MLCQVMELKILIVARSLGSPLPGVTTPSIAFIYSSRTALPIIIYSSTEQHHPYIFQHNSIASIYSSRTASYVCIRTLGVPTPGSVGPSPCSRTTRQMAADHWWFVDHSLRTAELDNAASRSEGWSFHESTQLNCPLEVCAKGNANSPW